MKVRELIEQLQVLDPELEIEIAPDDWHSQFSAAIKRVSRAAMNDDGTWDLREGEEPEPGGQMLYCIWPER